MLILSESNEHDFIKITVTDLERRFSKYNLTVLVDVNSEFKHSNKKLSMTTHVYNLNSEEAEIGGFL